VFDFCALEGLGAWLVARQPQLGSSQQLLLFDLIVPNEPGYVANVFDLRVPAVWVHCIQQHVTLPPILSLLSPVSHFVEHMHGDQPTTSGPAKQHLSAVETLRVSLPPAAAHALARRLATALARRSRASQRRSREPAARGRRQHGRCAGARAWPTGGESGSLAQAHAEVAVARDRACCRGSRSRTLNE